MNYETVFDSSTVPYGYGWAAAALAFATVIIIWAIYRLRRVDHDVWSYYRAFKDAIGFLVAIGFIVFIGYDWWTYQSVQTAAASGEGAEEIEGIVQDHWVKEQTRETSSDVRIEMVEHFRISTVEFEFAQGSSESRYFANAADHRVKLYDGMRLRIRYLAKKTANKIVKLEIAR